MVSRNNSLIKMMIRTIIFLSFYTLLGNALPFEKTNLGNLLQTSGRIINGENATLGQFPWHAVVGLGTNTSVWPCGGSIISDKWIVTAASCLYNAELAVVTVGIVYSMQEADNFEATEFHLHEEYDPASYANDIGLVKLTGQLTFNDVVAPIALASEPLEDGAEVTVTGFGATSTDSPTINGFLNYITVNTIPNSECAEIYGDAIVEGVVCTSAGSDPVKGICFGDSGGPAVLSADTDPVLVAVASFLDATACETENPSGFTRIAYYRDWIREQTGV